MTVRSGAQTRQEIMNKLSKGTLAAAAAVALLIGGGSTLAFWNDSINVGAATTITAGNLKLEQKTAPTWSVVNGATTTPVADINALRIVPGDKLVYTGTYTVTAQGQNLSFTTGVTEGSIAPATVGNKADEKLVTRLLQSAKYNVNGVDVPKGVATINHKSNASGTYDVVISVTLDWQFGTDGSAAPMDNDAKLGKVNLANFSIQAKQIAQP